ncbi:MAG: endonuclease/exonuclease/phosphatase family protein [bacterium]
MAKKILKFAFYLLALLVAGFGLFLGYALQPGVSPQKLAQAGILSFAPDAGKVPLSQPKELRVVTYNIGYASGEKNNKGAILSREEVEKNLDAIVTRLREFKPDLVFLQEVDFHAKRSFDIDQMRRLAEGLGLPYGAYVVTWNKKYVAWPYWPLSRHFGRVVSGQAVLSRFPIQGQQLIEFPKPAENPFWYNWFYLDRIVQHLTLQFGDGAASVYNVHLEAFAEATRREQLEQLSRLVKADPNGLKVVAGDFNLAAPIAPGKDDPDRDREGLLQKFSTVTQLAQAQGSSPLFSMPSWGPYKRIDHIFISPAWRLEKMGNFAGLVASDHLGIWAVFQSGQ